jgi:hypothetical protein
VTEYQALIILLQGIIIGIAGWALQRIISVDKKISGIDVWKMGHDKQDDERHQAISDSLEELRFDVKEHRKTEQED